VLDVRGVGEGELAGGDVEERGASSTDGGAVEAGGATVAPIAGVDALGSGCSRRAFESVLAGVFLAS
jgi:hypothetical protein